MASITLTIPDEAKTELKRFSWVNWSEVARKAIEKRKRKLEVIERLEKILSKSKFTKKDAVELSNEIKSSMHNRLKEEGLI